MFIAFCYQVEGLVWQQLCFSRGWLVAYLLVLLARLEEDRFAVGKCDFEKVRMLGCSL